MSNGSSLRYCHRPDFELMCDRSRNIEMVRMDSRIRDLSCCRENSDGGMLDRGKWMHWLLLQLMDARLADL